MLIPFLSFKGTTQAYLIKISITHNKNLNLLLNFLINCISALQILSLNPEETVLFLKFLLIDLCNYLANCSLNSDGILTPPPFGFLSKNL